MFIYPIYNHNWRNISTICIHNKTSIKRNILTVKQIHREVGWAKDLSAPLCMYVCMYIYVCVCVCVYIYIYIHIYTGVLVSP